MRVDARPRPRPTSSSRCRTGSTPADEKRWKYQRYIKDYLRCVAAIDDNVGRLLDYLDDEGLADDTIVIYTSDQGFFLGDHGWYDKRFMYEESLRMPLPRPLSARDRRRARPVADIVTNLDFAPHLPRLRRAAHPRRVPGRELCARCWAARRRQTGKPRSTIATGCTWAITMSPRTTASGRIGTS